MKGVQALVSLAALAFAVAGCGSGHRPSPGSITVSGTTTLSNVMVGTPITCPGGSPRVELPAGHAAFNNTSGKTRLRLTRHQDGSVTVSCTRK